MDMRPMRFDVEEACGRDGQKMAEVLRQLVTNYGYALKHGISSASLRF